MHVEAASLAGVPVRFRVEAPGVDSGRGRIAGRSHAMWAFALMAALVAAVALVLARRNLRQGRGDPRGALRVAGAVFLGNALAFLLGASHVSTLHEVYLLTYGFSRALWLGAQVWVLYLALEPHVRRLWPQMLIGWSRLLAGRVADPLVGRDLLVGLLAGSASLLVLRASARLGPSLGLPPLLFVPEAESLQPARIVAAFHLSVLSAEVMNVLVVTLLLILARLLLQRDALAGGAVTLLLTGTSRGASTLYSLVQIAVLNGTGVAVLVRYGLVAGLACKVADSLVDEASSLAGAPAWASAGLAIPLALLALLALHGWRAAVGPGGGWQSTVDGRQ